MDTKKSGPGRIVALKHGDLREGYFYRLEVGYEDGILVERPKLDGAIRTVRNPTHDALYIATGKGYILASPTDYRTEKLKKCPVIPEHMLE